MNIFLHLVCGMIWRRVRGQERKDNWGKAPPCIRCAYKSRHEEE